MRVLGYRERIWEGIMGNAEGKKLLKTEDKFKINCPTPSEIYTVNHGPIWMWTRIRTVFMFQQCLRLSVCSGHGAWMQV